MIDVIDYLNIPKHGNIKQKIFLKDILEEMDATNQERKMFSKEVKSIFLVGVLDKDTIKVSSFLDEDFRYESIYIFEVNLKNNLNLIKVNEKLHSVFPNPVLIVYKTEDKNILSTAPKRINKVDKDKSVIEDIYISNSFVYDDEHKFFYRKLNLQEINTLNLKHFYEMLTNIIYSERLIELIGTYPENDYKALDIRSKIKQIEVIKSSIKTYETRYQNEIMMKDKMEIHIKIQKEKQKLDKIINKLKEDLNNG